MYAIGANPVPIKSMAKPVALPHSALFEPIKMPGGDQTGRQAARTDRGQKPCELRRRNYRGL